MIFEPSLNYTEINPLNVFIQYNFYATEDKSIGVWIFQHHC